jgi:transcriptional regulator
VYIPAAFQETDRDALFNFIEQHSFGILVSQHGDAPFATHLPFLAERSAGEHGELIAHMARANPHWTFAEGQTVLTIFSGPHAYISPTWYGVPNAVPTWNYTAVHVTGVFETINDSNAAMTLLERTTAAYEMPQEKPWAFDVSNTFFSNLAAAVVAFRIRITSIEGKWKLNQNRPVEQQERVVLALERSGSEDDRVVAAMMKSKLAGQK